MTIEEICAAIEKVYGAELLASGKPYFRVIPQGVTPQAWSTVLPEDVESYSPAKLLGLSQKEGEGLARVALSLDLTDFARIEIEDRPQAIHRGSQRTNRRKRALIVRCLGWKE